MLSGCHVALWRGRQEWSSSKPQVKCQDDFARSPGHSYSQRCTERSNRQRSDQGSSGRDTPRARQRGHPLKTTQLLKVSLIAAVLLSYLASTASAAPTVSTNSTSQSLPDLRRLDGQSTGCPPGYGVQHEATSSSDVICEPCVERVTFSDRYDNSSRCQQCDYNFKCTDPSQPVPTVCTTVSQARCSRCPNNWYYDGQFCETCKDCRDGHIPVGGCNDTSNRICMEKPIIPMANSTKQTQTASSASAEMTSPLNSQPTTTPSKHPTMQGTSDSPAATSSAATTAGVLTLPVVTSSALTSTVFINSLAGGCIVLFAVTLLLAWFFLRRRQRKTTQKMSRRGCDQGSSGNTTCELQSVRPIGSTARLSQPSLTKDEKRTNICTGITLYDMSAIACPDVAVGDRRTEECTEPSDGAATVTGTEPMHTCTVSPQPILSETSEEQESSFTATSAPCTPLESTNASQALPSTNQATANDGVQVTVSQATPPSVQRQEAGGSGRRASHNARTDVARNTTTNILLPVTLALESSPSMLSLVVSTGTTVTPSISQLSLEHRSSHTSMNSHSTDTARPRMHTGYVKFECLPGTIPASPSRLSDERDAEQGAGPQMLPIRLCQQQPPLQLEDNRHQRSYHSTDL